MKASAIVSCAGLFSVVIAQTSKPVPSGQPDLTTCKEQAGPYAEYCARCNPKCESSSTKDECFYSLFSSINSIQSQCWQHGGNNCKEMAVDRVCGK